MSTLFVGDRVVAYCEDDLLEVEYALFSPSEVLVSAAPGLGVREQGYLTTAGFARDRLTEAWITPELVEDAFVSLGLQPIRLLARSVAISAIAHELGPYEVFEGGEFRSKTRDYAGVWLELFRIRKLCEEAGLPNASLLMQAMHLFMVVCEVPEDTPVRLHTARAMVDRRPGQRSHRKVDLEDVYRLPPVLHGLPLSSRGPSQDHDPPGLRDELLRSIRDRGAMSASPDPRLGALVAALTGKSERSLPETEPPPPESEAPRTARGVAPPASDPPALIVTDPPEDAERSPTPAHAGEPPLWGELRKHSEMLRGENHLRAVALFLSRVADEGAALPEVTLLAARAWLAAGERAHARHFARRVAEDASLPNAVRLAAAEILDATQPTQQSEFPPAVAPIPTPPATRVVTQGSPAVSVLPPAPPGASLPPVGLAPEPEVEIPIDLPDFSLPPAAAPAPAPAPARRIDAPPSRATATAFPAVPKTAAAPVPFASRRAEIVESLPLPEGVDESLLPYGSLPRDAVEARVYCTRLAKDLARDYRLWYGNALKIDPIAIDHMQRHLRRRFAEGQVDLSHDLGKELLRHGALFAEILSRTLGGVWLDVSDNEQGRWSMRVGASTVWPIGRVYRYYQQGHREADLVATYFELERALPIKPG